tara:strand:- start:47988 stop:48134 length:147 start_codon:yes stop_codon:yes gene_type:complete
MKDEIIEKIKRVEDKLAKGLPLEQGDHVFLFALSLIKGNKSEDIQKRG